MYAAVGNAQAPIILFMPMVTDREDYMGARCSRVPAGHEYSCGWAEGQALLAYGCVVPWQGEHAYAALGLHCGYSQTVPPSSDYSITLS